MDNRTVLLISCAALEATRIRETGRRRRQTVSGYVLGVVVNAVRADTGLSRLRALGIEPRLRIADPNCYGVEGVSKRPPGVRTTMLLSCLGDESKQIRDRAKAKGMSISGLVLHALRNSWKLETGLP
jgi:hypothetical protein